MRRLEATLGSFGPADMFAVGRHLWVRWDTEDGYKDKLGPSDNPREWEEQNKYGFWPPSIEYRVENSTSYQKRVEDGMWRLAMWMAGICGAILILYGILS